MVKHRDAAAAKGSKNDDNAPKYEDGRAKNSPRDEAKSSALNTLKDRVIKIILLTGADKRHQNSTQ